MQEFGAAATAASVCSGAANGKPFSWAVDVPVWGWPQDSRAEVMVLTLMLGILTGVFFAVDLPNDLQTSCCNECRIILFMLHLQILHAGWKMLCITRDISLA